MERDFLCCFRQDTSLGIFGGKKGAETGPVNLKRGILQFDTTSYLGKKSPDDSEDMKKYIKEVASHQW